MSVTLRASHPTTRPALRPQEHVYSRIILELYVMPGGQVDVNHIRQNNAKFPELHDY